MIKSNLLILLLIFSISIQSLHSQDITPLDIDIDISIEENKSNAFLTYMQGRSKIGVNIAPNILLHSLALIGNGLVKNSSIASTLESILPHAEEEDVVSEFSLKSKSATWGLSLYYDFTVLDYMAVSFDIGFADASISLEQIQYITYADNTTDKGLTDYNATFRTLSYSLGVKFFPWKQAPWGFYIMPKIGGTYVEMIGLVNLTTESDDNSFQYPIAYTSGHGIYASAEIGWNIKVFGGKDSSVEFGIDVALLDLGYYFVPWASSLISNLDGGGFIPDNISEYLWASNIRAMLLPRLGFSIRF